VDFFAKVTLRRGLANLYQLTENRVVKRARKLQAADWAIDPPHLGFNCFNAVELHPDTLTNDGSLGKLNLAARRRKIERPNAKPVRARAPDTYLGAQRSPIAALRR
jgi:hypothetical protein